MGTRPRTIAPLLLMVLAVLVLAPSARGMVAYTTPRKLALFSEHIFVGETLDVFEGPFPAPKWDGVVRPTSRLARLRVERPVKGAAKGAVLVVIAQPTWTCSETRAIAGERCLFFLKEPEEPETLPDGTPVLYINWSGYGRMPLATFDGRECAVVDTGIVYLPPDMPSMPGPNPRFPDFDRYVPLDVLLAHLRTCLDLPPPRELLPRLLATFDDVDEDYAISELEGLGEEAIRGILAILRDPRSPWRPCAAEAINYLDEGGEALIRCLDSEDVATRRGAAWALEWIGAFDATWDEALRLRLEETARRDPDPEVRRRVVSALAADSLDGFGPVIAALRDEDAGVRAQAALRMHQFDWMDAEELAVAEAPLLAMAAEDNLGVRRAAWEALGILAGKAALKLTLAAAADPDPVVRACALAALGRIGGEGTHTRLVAALTTGDVADRLAAAYALGECGTEESVPALAAALSDPDRDVREMAAWALEQLAGKDPARELTFLAVRDFCYGREITLGMPVDMADRYDERIRSLSLRRYPSEALAPLLEHRDPKVRTLALLALFDRNDPEQLPRIHSLVDDDAETFPRPEENVSYENTWPRYEEPTLVPQTVGDVAKRLLRFWMERSQASRFEEYYEPRAKRGSCAGWCAVRLDRLIGGMYPVPAPRKLDVRLYFDELERTLPPVDQELTLLLLFSRRDLAETVDRRRLVYAARRLGRDRLMEVLAGKPPTDDPDIGPKAGPPWAWKEMCGFIAANARELFRPSDADRLLPDYPIAAAELAPDRAQAILRGAFEVYSNEGDRERCARVAVAMARLLGDRELELLVEWFFSGADFRSLLLEFLLDRFHETDRRVLAAIVRDPRFADLDAALRKMLARGLDRNLLKHVTPEGILESLPAWAPEDD